MFLTRILLSLIFSLSLLLAFVMALTCFAGVMHVFHSQDSGWSRTGKHISYFSFMPNTVVAFSQEISSILSSSRNVSQSSDFFPLYLFIVSGKISHGLLEDSIWAIRCKEIITDFGNIFVLDLPDKLGNFQKKYCVFIHLFIHPENDSKYIMDHEWKTFDYMKDGMGMKLSSILCIYQGIMPGT